MIIEIKRTLIMNTDIIIMYNNNIRVYLDKFNILSLTYRT